MPPKEKKQVQATVRDNLKKSRTVYTLDSPFSAPDWPKIEEKDKDAILQILVRLLEPIGRYRLAQQEGSRGKRARRAKKDAEKKKEDQGKDVEMKEDTPEPPAISTYLTLGLNATTSALESLLSPAPPTFRTITPPPSPPAQHPKKRPFPPPSLPTSTVDAPLKAVFVCRHDSQPSQLHAHLPLMISLAQPTHTVYLVQLPKGADARLSKALGLPRVACLGLREGAPGAGGLWGVVEGAVGRVEVPGWVKGLVGEQGGEEEYREMKVKSLKTVVGDKKVKGKNKGKAEEGGKA